MRERNVVLGLLLTSLSLVVIIVYFQEISTPRWKRRFPLYKSQSSRYSGIIPQKNIWGVNEESFLKTPFFNGRECSKPEMTYKFKDIFSPGIANSEVIDLKQLPNIKLGDYYTEIKDKYCYTQETETSKSLNAEGDCNCKKGSTSEKAFKSEYNGSNCDIPGSVWKVPGRLDEGLQQFRLRQEPRRAIMGLVVDHELELTEIRIRELHQVVDIFVILEASVTSGGDPKPLYFLNAFRKGYLCEFQSQILYVYLDKFPKGYIEDGWLADGHLRNEMSQAALVRIQNLNDEDIFLSFDADELPKKETILFLRFHNGFTNPIHFNLRWTIFSFFWQHSENGDTMTKIVAACTVDFLKEVVDGNAISMRKKYFYDDVKKWTDYKGPKSVYPFEIGVPGDYSGHHCSWCTSPEGISIKLRSAIHQDFPRWGDFPEKLKLDFLTDVSQNGKWFDGGQPTSLVDQKADPDYAPEFMLQHPEQYRRLLKTDRQALLPPSPTLSPPVAKVEEK